MTYEYCVSSTISVALRIPEWGYGVHGHDVTVEACYKSEQIVDIEVLHAHLTRALADYDHRPLWETTENGLLESLLESLCRSLRLPHTGMAPYKLSASIPGRRITITCSQASPRSRPSQFES